MLTSLILAGVLVAVADDEQEARRPPLHAVTGTVTLDGKPLDAAELTLHALAAPAGMPPKGKTDKNGRFDLGTFKEGDGAPAGKYRVTIVRPEANVKKPLPNEKPKDLLNGRYDGERTPLMIEVKVGANQIDLALKSR